MPTAFHNNPAAKMRFLLFFSQLKKSILMILPTAGMAIVQIESEIEHTMGIPPLKQNNSFVQERMIDY